MQYFEPEVYYHNGSKQQPHGSEHKPELRLPSGPAAILATAVGLIVAEYAEYAEQPHESAVAAVCLTIGSYGLVKLGRSDAVDVADVDADADVAAVADAG